MIKSDIKSEIWYTVMQNLIYFEMEHQNLIKFSVVEYYQPEIKFKGINLYANNLLSPPSDITKSFFE